MRRMTHMAEEERDTYVLTVIGILVLAVMAFVLVFEIADDAGHPDACATGSTQCEEP